MSGTARSPVRVLVAVFVAMLLVGSLSGCGTPDPTSTPGVSEIKDGVVRLPSGEVAVIDQYHSKRHRFWRFTYNGFNTVYMDRPSTGWLDGSEHYEIYIKSGETIEPDIGWLQTTIKISIGDDSAAYIEYDTGWFSSWTYHPHLSARS